MAKKKKGQRADGYIEIGRTMPDGKVRHFYGSSRTECEAKYREALQQMVLSAQQEAAGPLFEDMAREWWAEKQGKIRHGTCRCYEPALRRVCAFFEGRRIKQIGAQDVAALLDQMDAAGLAAKTIRNTHTVLNMVFEYGASHYNMTYNPSRLISTPAGQKTKRKPPSQKQEAIIRQTLADAVSRRQVDDCIVLAAVLRFTGCRRGEALALRFQDIDRQQKRITFAASVEHRGNQPVTGKPKTDNGFRELPLLPQLADVLEAYGWRAGRCYVVGGGTTPLTNRQFSNRWIEFCRRCGLAAAATRQRKSPRGTGSTVNHTEYKALVTPHQFRHWFATDLYKAGVPMDVAVRMMGHADSAVIRRVYLDVDGELLDRGGALLSRFMEGETESKAS